MSGLKQIQKWQLFVNIPFIKLGRFRYKIITLIEYVSTSNAVDENAGSSLRVTHIKNNHMSKKQCILLSYEKRGKSNS